MEDFTFVVPALNEAAGIAETLGGLLTMEADILVVDNGSTDATADIASRLGVRVVSESRRGKGFSVMAGTRATSADWVFLCDADIRGLDSAMVERLLDARAPSTQVARLAIQRPPVSAPVTYLTALPLLRALGAPAVHEPLGGLALVRSSFLSKLHLPGGWGFDVALTLAALREPGYYSEIPVMGITHRAKRLVEYRGMAEQVAAAILRERSLTFWDHSDCTLCLYLQRAQY